MAHSISTWEGNIPSIYENRTVKNVIEWHGGECPVPIGTKVAFEHRGCFCLSIGVINGTKNWQHTGSDLDIVAYKILNKTKE